MSVLNTRSPHSSHTENILAVAGHKASGNATRVTALSSAREYRSLQRLCIWCVAFEFTSIEPKLALSPALC